MNKEQYTSYELDILGELGNIGAGNAATALSQILNKTVFLELPIVSICSITEITTILGGAENIKTCILFKVNYSLNGYMFFLLNNEDSKFISEIAAQNYKIDSEQVLSEIANIISGNYVKAISTMINDKINLSPPLYGMDMIGSLIDTAVSDLCNAADQTVIIGTNLVIDGQTISGFYVLMLEQDSLSKLLEYFKK